MRNNNGKIVSCLARKEYASDKGRRAVLTGAVSFAVMALFCVFSLAVGKIDMDMLRNARERGTVVDTTLERATQEQYEQIQKLSYIKDVGTYIRFGDALGIRCAVIDDVAWEKIKKPAFTDIHGTYPREKMEIMLPMSTLEWIGIPEPEIGMEIPITVEFLDGSQEEYSFILSGYYTEYIATLIYGPPDGYFSRAFLDSVVEKDEQTMTLLMKQDDRIEGSQVEERLYNDITMRDSSQQFIGGDTMAWQAFFSISGGFDTALVLSLVILLSAGLLIYNVLHISFERNVRQYGLLKTLGTTAKQLKNIVFQQVLRTVLWGSLLGGAAGTLIALAILPALLSKMYLYRFGSAAGMISFHPLLLLASVLFCSVVTFFSFSLAVRRTVRLTPVEAVHYMGRTDGETYLRRNSKKWKRSKKQHFQLAQMAWRNLLRFKKRFFISALCLVLGIVVSLGIIMISKGSDTTNEIEHIYYDCSVGTVISALDIADYYKETIFPESVKKELESLPEVADSASIEGGYGEILVEEECLALFCMESLNTDRYFYRAPFVVQILSDESLAELKEFAQEEGLYLDVEQVINGEGVILLHDHILSPTQIEQSKDTVGMPLGVYALEDSKTRRDMVFCGYLDSEYEGLPEIRTTWRSGSICYLLASEKGFQKMGLRERIFDVALNAKPQSRVLLDQKVSRIVEEYNQQFAEECEEYGWSPFVLEFVSKIDVLTSMKDYIVSSRLVMGSICAILFLMGLANYVNVTMTSLAVRRREFAVMESIGLTGKQLKRMLILEGIFYSLVITVLTALGGGMILFGIGKFMTERIEYFVVSYPVAEFAVCVLGLFVSCTLIVLFLHWKYGRTSISQRLRLYAD